MLSKVSDQTLLGCLFTDPSLYVTACLQGLSRAPHSVSFLFLLLVPTQPHLCSLPPGVPNSSHPIPSRVTPFFLALLSHSVPGLFCIPKRLFPKREGYESCIRSIPSPLSSVRRRIVQVCARLALLI